MSNTTIAEISVCDTFSGIGGIKLGLKMIAPLFPNLKLQVKQFVEIDKKAQAVLKTHFPEIPIYGDIKTYHAKTKEFDLICGGFPCTGTSMAGKRTGLAHSESELWWEMFRVIEESKSKFVFIEQPEGIIYTALRTILGGLRLAGYSTEVELISAAELGAPHRRNRIFIIAYSNQVSQVIGTRGGCWAEQAGNDIEKVRALTQAQETQPGSMPVDDGIPGWLGGVSFDGEVWGRPPMVSGIPPRTPGRVDCINLYGQSVCPLQVAAAGMRLCRLMEIYGN